MNRIQMLRRGAASVSLLLLLSSCANKPLVKTETVEVKVPVIVGVPDELTRAPAEPIMPASVREARARGGSSCAPGVPADSLANCVLADHIDALRAWGRGMVRQLRKVSGLADSSAK